MLKQMRDYLPIVYKKEISFFLLPAAKGGCSERTSPRFRLPQVDLPILVVPDYDCFGRIGQ